MKKYLFFIFTITLLALIFIHPSISYNGALSGLNLWLYNIMPTMLPCLIITDILKKINGIYIISKLPSKLLSPLLGISSISGYAILGGLICGYPIGAKLICDLYSNKHINKNEAEYLLTFSNNPGPIFISTYIFSNLLNNQYKYAGFVIIYLSIFLTALLYNIDFKSNITKYTLNNNYNTKLLTSSIETIDNSIYNSFNLLIKIGGYIILFSLISNIINYYVNSPSILSTFLIGLLEMTTGIFNTSMLKYPTYIKMSIMCILCILGGICTTLQTYSIIYTHHLSIKKYIEAKIITASIATILFTIYYLFI